MSLLSATILAADCDPNDTPCTTKQNQLQAMESAGIKPTPSLSAPPLTGFDNKKAKPNQPLVVEPQPFNVPPPPFAKQKDTVDSSDQDSTAATFAPIKNNLISDTSMTNTRTTTTTPSDSNENNTDQGPEIPATPQKSTGTQTGIQYR